MDKIAAKILVIDDDADILTTARVVLRQTFASVEVESNPQQLSYLLNHNQYDVILLDMNYSAGKISGNEGLSWLRQIQSINPEQRVILITAYGDIKLAVEAMKQGAADFIVKPWENERLIATVQAAYEHAVSKRNLQDLRKKQSDYSRVVHAPDTEFLGNSAAIQTVLNSVDKVAPTEANVLILGENGTGKELVAKLIHQRSHRSCQPFIKVDVGAIASNLFESELFGHKKGAFTDAREDRIGRIELANGGTLFLDEVGNLPLALQAKLLSVLQNREVTPLGSNKAVSLDIRLICATNLNIEVAVAKGEFREDLLYRIRTVEITLPPLRSRADDIPILVSHFIRYYSGKYRKDEKRISNELIKHLQKYHWPGNVRELQHAIERAVIMSDVAELTSTDFPLTSKKDVPDKKEQTLNLDDVEKRAILHAIEKHHGNMSKVARELGVGRTTLYRKMLKYGIDK